MIKLLGPSQYCNLKADMLSRNKIDAVNFELNNIDVKYEELLNLNLSVLEYNKDSKLLENKVYKLKSGNENGKYQLTYYDKGNTNEDIAIEIDEGIWNYSEDQLCSFQYHQIEDLFTDKYFAFIDGNVLNIAILIEPSDKLVFDSNIDIILEQENYRNLDNDPKFYTYSKQVPDYNTNLLYSEHIFDELKNANFLVDDVASLQKIEPLKIKYINEKQLIFYFKFNILNTNSAFETNYTEYINFSIRGRTWTANKTTHGYRMTGDNLSAEEIEQDENGQSATSIMQNPDGTFAGPVPKYPFDYHSNEILQYNTKVSNGLMHKYVAKELLTQYKSGRRCVEFDLPDVEIRFCDQYGEIDNEYEPTRTNGMSVGDELIIMEKYLDTERAIGGIYRDVKMWDKMDEKGLVAVNIPRRFVVTNIEYNYNGGLLHHIKALEISFATADAKARNNGQFPILIDGRGIPMN